MQRMDQEIDQRRPGSARQAESRIVVARVRAPSAQRHRIKINGVARPNCGAEEFAAESAPVRWPPVTRPNWKAKVSQ